MPDIDSFVEFLAEELLRDADSSLGLLIDAPASDEALWLAGPVTTSGAEGLVMGRSLVETLNKVSKQWGFTSKDLTIRTTNSLVTKLSKLATEADGAIKIFAPVGKGTWVVEVEKFNVRVEEISMKLAVSSAIDQVGKVVG